MDPRERYTDKLAKYILLAAGLTLCCSICWYFKNVIAYILIAVVVSLIAKPIMIMLKKITIKGKSAPSWLLAAISLILVIGIVFSIVLVIIPIVTSIIKGVSISSIEDAVKSIAIPLAELNSFLRERFTSLGSDFRIEMAVFQEFQHIFSPAVFPTVIGSAASFVSNLGIGLFSVAFIGFFFIKDNGLFTKIVCSLVPDKHEVNTEKAITDISYLLSRYFIGVLLEILGVTLLNFLGLLIITRLGVNAALGIAFLTGIFNIIPYVGPLMGGVLGTILGITLKYSSITPIGLDVNFWIFTSLLIAIFCFTQLIDNFLYQPVIYSTSIKAKPLEIFIVLLIAGHIGGPLAMIIAIPCYTAVRVIAYRFFGHIKAIKRLIPNEKLITDN